MHRRPLLHLFVVIGAFAAMTACGGGGGNSIVPPQTLQQQQRGTVGFPSQIDRALSPPGLRRATPPPPLLPTDPLSRLHKPSIAIHNLSEPIMSRLHTSAYFAAIRNATLQRSGGIKPMSYYTGNDQAGQRGMIFNLGYDDIYGNITAYTDWNNQWQLPPPDVGCATAPGGMGCPNNIAANLHAGSDPNTNTGNCLEAGTAFYETQSGGATAAIFWIGDFCNLQYGELEHFPIQANMDQNFATQYITNLGDGLPRITVELYQPVGDNLWHVILYNYYYNRWDDWYSASGNLDTSDAVQYTGQKGWSLDETHFTNSATTACPSMPTMSVNGIQVAVEPGGSDSNNYFRGLQFADYYVEYPSPAECFSSDGSGTPWYNFFTYTDQWNDQAWEATDPVPKPSPSFTPKPPPTTCGGRPCY